MWMIHLPDEDNVEPLVLLCRQQNELGEIINPLSLSTDATPYIRKLQV